MMTKNPEIEKILQVPWTYTLYQSGERLILSVLCRSRGGADYSMAIELGTLEIDAYRSLGKEAIDALASTINYDPSSYEERHIKGFSKWPKKTRFFIAGQRPVKIEDGPRGRREFAIDLATGEFVETERYIQKIFRDHSPDIDEVDQATFDQRVAQARATITDAKQKGTVEWPLGEETCFQYGIGNPHSPTDPFGRQEIQIYPDDTLEYLELGRGARRRLKAKVKAGLMRELCAAFRSGIFPDVPSTSKVLPAGAALATYRLWKGEKSSTTVVYPNSAIGWEGYDAVQPLMNRMTRALYSAARGETESELFFDVRDVELDPA